MIDDFYPLQVHLEPVVELTDEQFYQLCQLNKDVRIERSRDGGIVFMAPSGGATGHRNADLIYQLTHWARRDGTGVAFDSSAGFRLGGKAVRAPDASWVRRERLAELADEEKERFLPLCPDFIVELRSPSDSLMALQEKMDEYVANGLRLGWLIDPISESVWIYQADGTVEHVVNPQRLKGDPVLEDFELDLAPIWTIAF